MNKKLKKLEFWGYLLILLSTLIQIFFLPAIKSAYEDSKRYKLERKIDILYSISTHNFTKLNSNIKQPLFNSDPNYFTTYEYAEDKYEMKTTDTIFSILTFIFAVCFLTGSVLLVKKRHLEFKIEI